MKDFFIKQSNGRLFTVPMFDPVVSEHFGRESSYIDALLADINLRDIYDPLFRQQHDDGRYSSMKNDLVFLDIGANIGLVSIYAAPSCKRIVALEPDPWNWLVLKSMVQSLPIEIQQIALAPTIGLVDFYQNDLNTTASSTVNTYGKKTRVQSWTLMETLRVCQLEHVDICKIDAEGAEHESLSAHQLLQAKDIVHTYYIENHNTPTSRWEFTLGMLVTRFSELGYYKMKIDGMTLTASKP